MKGNNILKFIDKNIAINKAIGLVGGIDLMALRSELVDTIDKAEKWDEKETPYVITDSDGIFGTCKCNYVVSNPQIYCYNCGQKLNWGSEV